MINRKSKNMGMFTAYVVHTVIMVGLYCFYLVVMKEPLPVENLVVASLIAGIWCLSCIFVAIFLLRLPILSFPVWFLVATWLFVFSIFVLHLFDGPDVFRQKFIVVSIDHISQGLPIAMLAFSSFILGAVIANRSAKPQALQSIKYTTLTSKTWEVAVLLYGLSLAVILFDSLRGSGLAIVYNYAYSGNIQGFSDLRKTGQLSAEFLFALYWFLPWASLLLVSTSRSDKQTRASIFLFGLVIVIGILVGDRDIPLTLIVLGLGVYYLRNKGAIQWKHIATSLVILLLLLRLVPDVRKVPVKDWSFSLFADSITENFVTNEEYETPLGSVFSGFAGSYQTFMGTLMFVPNSEPFRYGADYLSSIRSAIPYSSRFLPESTTIKPTTWITQSLQPGRWSGLGYLQIAEAYLQFGAIGVVGLYLLLGWGLVRVWRKLESGATAEFLAFTVILMQAIFTWIRNDSGGIPRSLFWAWILVYILPTILSKRSVYSANKVDERVSLEPLVDGLKRFPKI